MSEASGLSRTTIYKAMEELTEPPLSAGWVRREGGGRKRLSGTAVTLLGYLGPRARPAIPNLWELLRNDPDEEIREAASHSLVRIE